MSWIADAHTEWHAVNGRWGCPLDCAWSDPGLYDEPEMAEPELDYAFPIGPEPVDAIPF